MAVPKPHSHEPFQWKPLRTDQDLKDYERLLNEAFQVSPGRSFFEDFPIWNHPLSSPRLQLGVWDQDVLVGGACARIVEVQLQGFSTSLKAGLIGGIVTDSKYRKKGLASEATQKLLDWLKRQHVPLAVLWGSEYSLYQKIGFELCGIQYRVPITQLQLPKQRKSGYQLHYGWSSGIFDLIQKRSCGIVLTEQDRSWYEAHKNVQWVWAESALGVEAYVAWNRGIDLNGMIHEWGGEPEALVVLLHYLQHQKPELEIIGHPAVFEEFDIQGAPVIEEYLCLAHIIDLKEILGPLKISAKSPQNQNLHQWLFGPPPVGGYPPGGFHGLPLWFWGLDAC